MFRKLGQPHAQPDGALETFTLMVDRAPLEVTMKCTEFTCRCPVTNQPDWATIVIKYTPDRLVVESKALKLYLETFRDAGIFHEHLVDVILKDLVTAVDPFKAVVEGRFNSRGGIAITAKATYRRGLEVKDEDPYAL